MQALDNLAFGQWLIQVVMLVFVVGGLTGIAVGIGLLVNSPATLAMFASLNRWTSMRRTLKPLEIPRDTTRVVQRYRPILATAFVAGGLFALYVLVTQYSAEAIVFSLGLGTLPPLVYGLLLEVTRAILIVGNLTAVVVGLMMFFSPATLNALEARGSKWFSHRAITQKGDEMHTPIDRWVAASPRAAGAILAIGSLVVVVNAVMMLGGSR